MKLSEEKSAKLLDGGSLQEKIRGKHQQNIGQKALPQNTKSLLLVFDFEKGKLRPPRKALAYHLPQKSIFPPTSDSIYFLNSLF